MIEVIQYSVGKGKGRGWQSYLRVMINLLKDMKDFVLVLKMKMIDGLFLKLKIKQLKLMV